MNVMAHEIDESTVTSRDPRFDILFEPIQIGHLLAKNRFYQPPHCNGMGNVRPEAHAAMRGMKAAGGWAVINTEHTSIHPTSDLVPEVLQTIWDDGDIPVMGLMCDEVHKYGALAGVQLAYSAYYNANKYTREVPMGPMARPVDGYYPVQARAMDKQDIRNLRGWMRAASGRARKAGFDIINVDANFSTIAFQFLSPRNQRCDEYGGSLANRVRLLSELIAEAREGSQGECAVSVRLIVDELCGKTGLQVHDEGLEAIRLLSDLPDLWDIVVGTWTDDSPTSRFVSENDHEPFMLDIKSATKKPVVGVGRYTSPDTMASLLKRGVLDMIGATRPSIADPYLPAKIEQGRYEDIRECIGCNICVSSHYSMTNLRCTQNPTMGEEWRKGWHPEQISRHTTDDSVLVIGSGPAGLECARALGQRGYEVILAEKGTELGGRVTREGALPGLGEWRRVRDWRLSQINKLTNVQVYLDSDMTAENIPEVGANHVVLATGARWRADGVGRAHGITLETRSRLTLEGHEDWLEGLRVATPDDVMDGENFTGNVIVYDDDHYYMGGVVAEKLARGGANVTIVTPAMEISAFGLNTLEVPRTARRLGSLGVKMITHHQLLCVKGGVVQFGHVYTGTPLPIEAEAVILVTARLPEDALFHALNDNHDLLQSAGVKSVSRIGDCFGPGAIFHAVYAGHRFAREFQEPANEVPFKRERIVLERR